MKKPFSVTLAPETVRSAKEKIKDIQPEVNFSRLVESLLIKFLEDADDKK